VVNFGAWHAVFPVFLANLTGKKSMIILGGFDASSIPSLKYGVFHKTSALQWWMRKTYRWATYLCPVSEALVASVNTFADPTGAGFKNGILHFMPELKDKIHVIPTDYDDDFWTIDEKVEKKGILVLAYIYNTQTYLIKGFDLIIQSAVEMKDYEFTVAGLSPSMILDLQNTIPDNVKLLSFQDRQQTLKLYQRHKIFLIPSLTEGLPNTLCEAMLCGCIPIVSKMGILPDILGGHGLILERRNVQLLRELISQSSTISFEPQNVRQRIIEQYPRGLRLNLFRKLIEK
jgi:glycosyltransferase involved in cell wall biosynthesis